MSTTANPSIFSQENNTLYDLIIRMNNEKNYIIDDDDVSSKITFSYTLGTIAGRTRNFFTRRETKAITLTSYWGVETVLYFVTAYTLGITAVAIILPVWAYGTYSLFSLISKG